MNINRLLNQGMKIIVFVLACYLFFFLGVSLIYAHRTIISEKFNSYVWFFHESSIKNIDTFCYGGDFRNKDILFSYIYKTKDTKYQIGIWEFKNKRLKDISNSKINLNVDLENIKFWAGETLDKGSSPETKIRFGPFFKNSVNISIDNYSKVEKLIEKDNYKGFYGSINKFALIDDDKPKVLIEYPSGKEFCMVLLCKGNASFYTIIISSEKPFDESIIDIFNLSPSNLR